MFSQLSDKLAHTFKNLRGQGKLTEANIKDTMQQIRHTLLEADVALSVVQKFVESVKQEAIGKQITGKINPSEALIKIVKDQLIELMGGDQHEISLSHQPPVVILVCGLQGSGKTTSLGKLAYWLQQVKNKKNIMMVSADVYRPAAREQLATLAEQVAAKYLPVPDAKIPVEIVTQAIETAKANHAEVLLVDTAGRTNIDQELMQELKEIYEATDPAETLLVLDSMTGQESAQIALKFAEHVDISGVILTKADGDARGGAALSVPSLLGKPVKMLGVGEKIDALEVFHPDRMASRILGMGDLASLLESAEQKVDKQKTKDILKKGKRFDLTSFKEQLQQLKKMGGMQKILSKLPSGALPPGANMAGQKLLDDTSTSRMEAMINSMTPQERAFPALINGSRKRRITKGSGTQPADLNKLLKQFTQMQKQLKKLKGGTKSGKGSKLQKRLKRMQGQMPPGTNFDDLL